MTNQQQLTRIAKEQGREEFKKDKIEKIKKEIKIRKFEHCEEYESGLIEGLNIALEILEK